MSDNLKVRQPQDPKKINLSQTWEVSYWTKDLGISEEELKKAVKAVGVEVAKVKEWLGNN